MSIRMSSCCMGFLILTSMFYVILTILPGNVQATTLYVGGAGPGNYTTIQDAINASIPGNVVYVYNGTYYEHIIIPHPLSLFGEDNETTIVDAGGSGDAAFIDADWVNVTGFTLRNAGPDPNDSGIELNYTQNCYIANNTILGNWYGVYLVYSDGNTILNNNISSSSYSGIRLYGSYNNDIVGNSVSNNDRYGIQLSYSDGNDVSDNGAWSNDQTGILLEFSMDNNITNNDVFLNVRWGICLDRSERNSVENNSASHNNRGIYLATAHYSHVSNNTATNNSGRGLHFGGTSSSVALYNILASNEMDDFFIDSSNNNIIRYNDVSDSDRGVHLLDSRNNTIRDNVFVNAGISIQSNVLDNWNSHTIDTTNTVNGKPVRYLKNIVGGTIPLGAGQIILANCTGVVVENQNVSDGSVGIQLGFSSNNTIARNVADGNTLGIHFSSSHSNVIDNNALANNDIGFGFKLSNDNLVTNESVSNSSDSALYIVDSQRNLLQDNVLSDNDIGINLAYSVDHTIENTTMIASGIFVAGDMLNHWNSHRIDTSNSVNGRPVYYWKNVSGGTVPMDGGQVILANCTGVNVTGQELSDATRGVTLGYSSYNTISDLVAHYNSRNGIFLYRSDSNNITNSSISHTVVQGIQFSYSSNNNMNSTVSLNNRYGLYMYGSDQNVFLNNTFSLNVQQGAYMSNSDSNTLSGNTFQANQEFGLYVRGSSGNLIYHNNFLNNSNQSFDNVANSWDNGYPSGGNYWGDYNGTDTKNGINQDLPGSDGIGDIPFNITGGSNQDRYPLMNPLVVLPIVPSEPQNLQAMAGSKQVSLSWSQPVSDGGSPITNYRIYRGNTPGGEVFLAEVGNVLTHVDGGLTDGQTYYYQVSALNVAGEGPRSNEANATPTTTQTVPSEPLKPVATPGNGEITLTWNPPSFDGNSSITNYRIYRGTTPGGETFLLEIGNVTMHADTGLANGQTYYYQISAVNAIGEGPLSNETYATPTSVPGRPTALQASLTGYEFENVTLTWSLSTDDGSGQNSVVSYEILKNMSYDPDCLGYQTATLLPNGSTELTIKFVGEGDPQNYFYGVCAVDLNGLRNCSMNQAAKFTRPLSKGPNLVSIPLIQSDETIQIVLQTLSYDNAWSYDSINQEWRSFSKSKPYGQSLEYLNHTMGIWINVTQDSNLTVAGVVPTSTTIDLQAGWNLVGFPSFDANFTVADLKAVVAVERTEGFDALVPPYFLRAMNDGDFLQAGFGYWIRVQSATIWTVENI